MLQTTTTQVKAPTDLLIAKVLHADVDNNIPNVYHSVNNNEIKEEENNSIKQVIIDKNQKQFDSNSFYSSSSNTG